MITILVSAGDLSGERYAAGLVRAIRAKHPDSCFVGLGGAEMAKAGVELVVDQRELAVGGIFELAGSLVRLIRAWRAMVRCLRHRRPDLVVLVDSGGFNLPFARRVRQLGGARILYYVAPQVWAWRQGRMRKLIERADRIAVILPFEKEFYDERGIEVDFVGHPLLDDLARDPRQATESRRRQARSRIGLDSSAVVLGLFPGSRRSELARHLEIQIETFRLLRRDRPELQAVLGLASSLAEEKIEEWLAERAPDLRGSIHVARSDPGGAMDAVDVALAKPGTITLELSVRGCPMVVVGRVHRWTAWIVRSSLHVTQLSLPNLILGEAAVPELLQEDARPHRIAAATAPLFEGEGRHRQQAALALVLERLGTPGAATRAASIVEELLGNLET